MVQWCHWDEHVDRSSDCYRKNTKDIIDSVMYVCLEPSHPRLFQVLNIKKMFLYK
jgi:hypothetical protein